VGEAEAAAGEAEGGEGDVELRGRPPHGQVAEALDRLQGDPRLLRGGSGGAVRGGLKNALGREDDGVRTAVVHLRYACVLQDKVDEDAAECRHRSTCCVRLTFDFAADCVVRLSENLDQTTPCVPVGCSLDQFVDSSGGIHISSERHDRHSKKFLH
jgi:hypothetical protein